MSHISTREDRAERMECLRMASGNVQYARRLLNFIHGWEEVHVERPTPVKWSAKEGDAWVAWGESRATTAHAIVFSDGSEFDMVNGWRRDTI